MAKRVAVIGAGMAGLAAARLLREAGLACVLFDKSRGLGGRMATRRIGALAFDHGAQYFTARGPRFSALVEDWRKDGVAARWFDEAIVGAPGMTAPARAMAQGFETVLGFEAKSLKREPSGWSLHAADASHGSFDAVIVATPAPQAIPILATGGVSFPALAKARYAPCLALMLAFDGAVAFEGESLRSDAGPIAWIARNSSKPDRAGDAQTFVVHAGPEWSLAHLEETPEAILAKLSPLALEMIGASAAPVYAAAHRWRYALVQEAAGAPCFFDEQAGLGACGDYCIGPRVEAAFDSGEAMARKLIDSWGPHVRA